MTHSEIAARLRKLATAQPTMIYRDLFALADEIDKAHRAAPADVDAPIGATHPQSTPVRAPWWRR